MLADPDRSSKLSVISDVSRQSDTYGDQPTNQQLLLLVEQLRIENDRLKRQQRLQEEKLALCNQQLKLSQRPELQEFFQLQNASFELKTQLSTLKIAQMEQLKRVHQLHTKEKNKLHTEFEQRLKINKQAYNRELNDIKLMIKSKGDERDIIKEQQEKLGLCLDEIKNLERQNDELRGNNFELKKDVERANTEMQVIRDKQQHNEQRRNRHENEQMQAMEERISLKTDQIRVIQSELNIQKDLTVRLEGENQRLRESLQQAEQELQQHQNRSVGNRPSNQPDYQHLFLETKKLNESLTGEVQRCYQMIRKLETEQQEQSRIRLNTTNQNSLRHKTLEEECFELRKELSDVKIKLANAVTENRYLQTTVEQMRNEKQLSKRNSLNSQGQGNSQVQLDALIRDEAMRKELAVKDEQLTHMMNELAANRSAIEELNRNVSIRDETIEHLRSKLLEVQAMNMQLMLNSRHSIQASPAQTSEEIASLRSENQRFKEQYISLTQEAHRMIEESEAKVIQANNELERLQIDLQEVNSWNHQLQEHEANYRQQRDAITLQKNELAVERNIFVEKIQQLQEQNDTYRRACEKVLEDRNQLHAQKAQLETELSRIKEAVPRHIEEKVSSAEKQSEVLLDKIEQLKRSLQSTRASKQEAEQKLKLSQDEQALLEEKIELLKGMKAESEKRAKEAESVAQEVTLKLTKQQSSSGKNEEDNKTLRQELVARKNDYDRLMHEHQQSMTTNAQHINNLESKVKQLLVDIAAQKKQYEDTTRQMFDEQTQRYHKLNDSTLKLESDLKRLREESQVHRGEVALVNREKAELFSRLERTRQQLSDCQDRLQQTENQLSVSISKQEQLEEYVKQLELKCNMTEEMNAQLQQQQDLTTSQLTTNNQQSYLNVQNELHSVKQTVESLSKGMQAIEKQKTELVRELYNLRKSNTGDVTFSSAYPVTMKRESTVAGPNATYMYFKPPVNDYTNRTSNIASSPLQFEQYTESGSRVAPPWRTSQMIPVRDTNSPSLSKVTETAQRRPNQFIKSAVGQHRPSPSSFN